MKLIFSLLVSAGIILTNSICYSQYVPGALSYPDQAIMFSSYNYTGSARIQGLGNTQISLGGDISSALANPAGLGFYNRSEMSITPAYNVSSASSTYLSNETNSTVGNFNLNNLGVVFNKTKDDAIPGKWRGGSFAISFSKVNDFNNEIKYSGQNENNNILDYYVQDANEQNVDGPDLQNITKGAYSTYLISEFLDAYIEGNDTTYTPFYYRTFFSEFPKVGYPTHQSEIMSSSGSQNQWNFSFGGNYDDFIYIGATLGIQSLNYNIVKQYTESYQGYDIVLKSSLTEDLSTKGYGVNATFGIIARPIKQVTIGFSLITPTYLSLSERYEYTTTADFNSFEMTNYGDYFDANYDLISSPNSDFTTFYEDDITLNNPSYSEESTFDYTLTTPLRLNGGATFFINKNGFISADIEYVQYSSMNLKDEQGFLENDNQIINDLYNSVLNYRVGGEWRMKSIRLRAGYNYQPSPYNVEDMDRTMQTFSAGLGYRTSTYYVDLAVSYKQFQSIYAPYVLENPYDEPYLETSTVEIENFNLNTALTVGLFF